MNIQEKIQVFVSHKRIALVGYSRNAGAFSRMALEDLRKRGYEVYPINPHAAEIDGETCYSDFQSLPQPVHAALFVTSAETIRNVYPKALENGVTHFWIQQGVKDKALLKELDSIANANVVHSRCILMYAEPILGFHKVHRWFHQLLVRK